MKHAVYKWFVCQKMKTTGKNGKAGYAVALSLLVTLCSATIGSCITYFLLDE
jgi:hypothetical protein